jgi:hypothetical protein
MAIFNSYVSLPEGSPVAPHVFLEIFGNMDANRTESPEVFRHGPLVSYSRWGRFSQRGCRREHQKPLYNYLIPILAPNQELITRVSHHHWAKLGKSETSFQIVSKSYIWNHLECLVRIHPHIKSHQNNDALSAATPCFRGTPEDERSLKSYPTATREAIPAMLALINVGYVINASYRCYECFKCFYIFCWPVFLLP